MVDPQKNTSILVMQWIEELRKPINVLNLSNFLTGLVGKYSRNTTKGKMDLWVVIVIPASRLFRILFYLF